MGWPLCQLLPVMTFTYKIDLGRILLGVHQEGQILVLPPLGQESFSVFTFLFGFEPTEEQRGRLQGHVEEVEGQIGRAHV